MPYLKEFTKILGQIEVRGVKNKIISLGQAVSLICPLLRACARLGNKVILVGNGGSASIASHIATDLLKNCRIPALVFSDASLLTCVSNDLGYPAVFKKPIEIMAQKGDILIAISSSGKSENILQAALTAKNKGCFIVTLSGFKRNNPLRKLGKINFYVPSCAYGFVEIAHLFICHIFVDQLTLKE